MTAATEAEIWADGALTTAEAMVFLQRGARMFSADAKKYGWPRRYRGKGALWPKRLLAEHLASLPSVRGKAAGAGKGE